MTIHSDSSTTENPERNRAARRRKGPAETVAAAPTTPLRSANPMRSKADLVIMKLGSAKGVTVQQMMEATGWQSHSVRGFLSGVVRKKLGHDLVSEVGKDGARRYRIAAAANAIQE